MWWAVANDLVTANAFLSVAAAGLSTASVARQLRPEMGDRHVDVAGRLGGGVGAVLLVVDEVGEGRGVLRHGREVALLQGRVDDLAAGEGP